MTHDAVGLCLYQVCQICNSSEVSSPDPHIQSVKQAPMSSKAQDRFTSGSTQMSAKCVEYAILPRSAAPIQSVKQAPMSSKWQNRLARLQLKSGYEFPYANL
jgi:hypothetical protein